MSNERKSKIIVVGHCGCANYYSMFAKICENEIQTVNASNKTSRTKMKKLDMYFDYEKESSKEPNYGWYRKHDKNRRYKKWTQKEIKL